MTATAESQLDPYAERCRAEAREKVADARKFLASTPTVTATEVVAPIINAMLVLFDLREAAEEHATLVEYSEFDNLDVTAAEVAASYAALALHHHVADLLAKDLAGFVTQDVGGQMLAAQIRGIVSVLMGTELLASACRSAEHEKLL